MRRPACAGAATARAPKVPVSDAVAPAMRKFRRLTFAMLSTLANGAIRRVSSLRSRHRHPRGVGGRVYSNWFAVGSGECNPPQNTHHSEHQGND